MLEFVVDLAREAGSLLRAGLQRPRELAFKSRADIVTNIDLASEKLLVAALRERFPDHTIVAEEGGGSLSGPSGGHPMGSAQQQEYLWLIDPVDGTTNYAHGYPVFAV